MAFFEDWGYVSNPFNATPIQPKEKETELLVGRKVEKKKIKTRLMMDAGIVTIEGENGIGKTSVINTCMYELFEESQDDIKNCLYIPCLTSFQLSNEQRIEDFINGIYFSVAQTIVAKKDILEYRKIGDRSLDQLDKWLNRITNRNFEGQILGVGGGYGEEMSSTDGFQKSGFKKHIQELLKKFFPTSKSGGILCLIDNLELLETSDAAKTTLEAIRDELLNIEGLKWFFSGSHNIFRSIVGSTRLSGFLMDPIKIERLSPINVPLILSTRIKSFQSHIDDEPYCPINAEDFIKLFDSVNGNIRELFKRLTTYYLYVYESNIEPYFESEKADAFDMWLKKDVENEFNALVANLEEKERSLLKLILFQEETPITAKVLEKNDLNNFIEVEDIIKKLERSGLLVVPILENDLMRKQRLKKVTDLLRYIIASPKCHYIKGKLSESSDS